MQLHITALLIPSYKLQGLVLKSSTRAKDLQSGSGEHGRNADFCPGRHIQMPDLGEGQDEHQEIRKAIDGRSDDVIRAGVDAVAFYRGIPDFATRDAMPDLDERCCQIDGCVQPDEEPGDVIEATSLLWGEDPHKLQENRELGKEEGGGVKNLQSVCGLSSR